MEAVYSAEKRALIEKYTRLRPWYEGSLQTQVRTTIYDGSGSDPIINRLEWDGFKFWQDAINCELNRLDRRFEIYTCPEDPSKYMWVGINPDIRYFPSISALYERLKLLDMRYYAVVEAHTESGYRPHIHMILFTHMKPHRIVEKFAKHFECEKHFVEAKNYTKFYTEKLAYLNGKKRTEKEAFVLNDRLEREGANIPDLIKNNL